MEWSIRYANDELSSVSETENYLPIQSISRDYTGQSDYAKYFVGQHGSIYSRLNDGTGRWHRRINKTALNDDTRSYKNRGHITQYTVFVHPKVSYGVTVQSVFGNQKPVKVYKKDGKDFAFSIGYEDKPRGSTESRWLYLNKDHVSVEPKVGWIPVQFGAAHWDNGDVDANISHVGSAVAEIGY